MSQQNHNVNYLVSVDGITVWERLRVIRNFLEDREIALEIAELSMTKELDEEQAIMKRQVVRNIEDCKREITFLKELENKLAIEAEKSRVNDKSDDEMYEINFYEELIQQQLLTVQSEVLTIGRVSTETMKSLIKNPTAMKRVIESGLIGFDENTLRLIGNKDSISYLPYIQGEIK